MRRKTWPGMFGGRVRYLLLRAEDAVADGGHVVAGVGLARDVAAQVELESKF